MKKIVIFSIFVLLFSKADCQELDSFSVKVIEVFKQNDTLNLEQLFFNPEIDAKIILPKKIPTITIENNQKNIKEFEESIKNAFLVLRKKSIHIGVDWNKVSFFNFNFNISWDKQLLVPTASGRILFYSEGKKFAIVIPKMVSVKSFWKVFSIDISVEN
jgi:hypothetical protein